MKKKIFVIAIIVAICPLFSGEPFDNFKFLASAEVRRLEGLIQEYKFDPAKSLTPLEAIKVEHTLKNAYVPTRGKKVRFDLKKQIAYIGGKPFGEDEMHEFWSMVVYQYLDLGPRLF